MAGRRRRRDPVADAHQQLRELRNKLHGMEQETVLPLRSQIAQLQRDNADLTSRLGRLQSLHQLYRDAWESMVKLSHGLLASGKDA
jgi:prefoldin subunit 5